MATTADLRQWWQRWFGESAKRSKSVRVNFYSDTGRVWRLPVADRAGPAFEALSAIFRKHDYGFNESAGGTWVVRPIDGSGKPSLHSYGIALDINPSKNPHDKPLRTNLPAALIADVEALRTRNGKRVFSWGGRWATPDAMHFQIDCKPADLLTGIVIEDDEEDDVTTDELRAVLREEFGIVTKEDHTGSEYQHSWVVGNSVWRSEVGRGDAREYMSTVLVQARSYARTAATRQVSAEVDEDEIVAGIVDAVTEIGVADKVADELARRLVD